MTGEEGEGALRRRLTGRLGRGGLTATGGLVLGATGGGLRSRPCSSSMTSEAPSGQSSRSERETERRRMFRSSTGVTVGNAEEEEEAGTGAGLTFPGLGVVEVSEWRRPAFCLGLRDDNSRWALPGISKDSRDRAIGSLGEVAGRDDFLSGILGRILHPSVEAGPVGVPAD